MSVVAGSPRILEMAAGAGERQPALLHRGDPALESGGSHFGAPAWVLDELVEAGFDLFATATNHCLDYSISGLLHSIEAMEARGLSFAGVGRNLEEARRDRKSTRLNSSH